MAKDMHQEEWDEVTLTKLKVFEQYLNDWLNIALNYKNGGKKFETLEIYDLFCGSGGDKIGQEGSPLRILETVLKRNKKGKKIKIYFNDYKENKINELKETINNRYGKELEACYDVELFFTSKNIENYEINSKNFYKLIFLDQYGIKYSNKAKEFLSNGTDILMFVSSSHIRRFLEDKSFQKYIDSQHISKEYFQEKSSYETHRVIAQYFKSLLPNQFVSPFSLIRNNNSNGLIFISSHQKGLEQFLKTAWKIDPDFGESNKDSGINKDLTKDKGSLFYNTEEPEKIKSFRSDLLEFLRDFRDNRDIKAFGLEKGFLTRHIRAILEDNKNNLECNYFDGAKSNWHLDDEDKKVEIRIKHETNKN